MKVSRVAMLTGVLWGLLAPAASALSIDEAALKDFGGRLHPLLVHLPIGLVLGGALFEFLAMLRSRAVSPSAVSCFTLAWIAAAAAAGSGWLLAEESAVADSLEDTLELHRWSGVAVGGVALLASLFGWAARRRERPSAFYRVLVFAAAATVSWTGHLGGTLVWGEGYLTEPFETRTAPVRLEETSAVAGARSDAGERDTSETSGASGLLMPVSFSKEVEPILRRHCYECHAGSKKKGNLRLDGADAVFGGPESDWSILPGDPDGSKVIQRVLLPPTHKRFMPKKGEPLEAAEIEILRRWIAEGASFADAATGSEEPPRDEAAASAGIEDEGSEVADPSIDVPARLAAIRERGGAASPLAVGSLLLDVNLGLVGKDFRTEDLDLLAGLEDRVADLDLSGLVLDAAALDRVAAMKALERLNLSRTQLDDAGLARLGGLSGLRWLNLYGTRVSDAGLEVLAGLEALEKVYLWDSAVSAEGAAALRERRPDLKVDRGESLLPAEDG